MAVWVGGFYSSFFLFVTGITVTNSPLPVRSARVAPVAVEAVPVFPDVVGALAEADPIWVSALDESEASLRTSMQASR